MLFQVDKLLLDVSGLEYYVKLLEGKNWYVLWKIAYKIGGRLLQRIPHMHGPSVQKYHPFYTTASLLGFECRNSNTLNQEKH